ncbi:MAG: hypothetical protein R3F62_04990 [Planctomycetota bacterium]
MDRLIRRRRRAEGMTEYTILLTIVMVCSVVGLLSAGSRAMRQIAADKNLCKIEGKDCEGVEPRVTSGSEEDEDETGEASEDEDATDDEGQTEGEEDTIGESEDGSDGSSGSGDAEDMASGSSSSTTTGSSTVSAWDRFWGPLASNPMVMGFAGIMGWFV